MFLIEIKYFSETIWKKYGYDDGDGGGGGGGGGGYDDNDDKYHDDVKDDMPIIHLFALSSQFSDSGLLLLRRHICKSSVSLQTGSLVVLSRSSMVVVGTLKAFLE